MQLNTQPVEKPIRDEKKTLDVHSVWDTIQGEGPFAGTPATFIRLAGCNLACSYCDTDYTSKREKLSTRIIFDRVDQLPRRKLVVITGGEPFRQDCTDLVWRLVISGRKVQFETNGTLFLGFDHMNMFKPGEITIVCSPKTPKLCDEIVPFIDAFKYVVADGEVDTDGLPLKSVGPQYGRPARPPEGFSGDIYVQPLDVQDEKENVWHLAAAVKSCMTHGYKLCLQTHKIAGLP